MKRNWVINYSKKTQNLFIFDLIIFNKIMQAINNKAIIIQG